MGSRLFALVAGVAFAVGCSGGAERASVRENSESFGGSGGDGGDGGASTATSVGGSVASTDSGGSGGSSSGGSGSSDGEGGAGSRLGGPLPNATSNTQSSSTSGSGGSGIGPRPTTSTAATSTSSGGSGGVGGSPSTEGSTTSNQACDCEEGDPCCDGCQVGGEGCTDVAAAACEMALEGSDVFACPREDWETSWIEWRCPSNMGDEGTGFGCPDLGPLDELVGDRGTLGDEAIKFTIRVDCAGQANTLQTCVNFENDQFDQCLECQ